MVNSVVLVVIGKKTKKVGLVWVWRVCGPQVLHQSVEPKMIAY